MGATHRRRRRPPAADHRRRAICTPIRYAPEVPSAQVKSARPARRPARGRADRGRRAGRRRGIIRSARSRRSASTSMRDGPAVAIEGGQRLHARRSDRSGRHLVGHLLGWCWRRALPGSAVDIDGVGLEPVAHRLLDVLRARGRRARGRQQPDDGRARRGEPVGTIRASRPAAPSSFSVDPAKCRASSTRFRRSRRSRR